MKRIQRQRTKGWRMPPMTLYVGRPSHWGNPFEVGASFVRVEGVPTPTLFHPERLVVTDVFHAVGLFRQWLVAHPERLDAARRMLVGHDLACWCPLDQPCHADVLIELLTPTTDPEACRSRQEVKA